MRKLILGTLEILFENGVISSSVVMERKKSYDLNEISVKSTYEIFNINPKSLKDCKKLYFAEKIDTSSLITDLLKIIKSSGKCP